MHVSIVLQGEEGRETLRGREDGHSRLLKMVMALYMCRVAVLMVQQ